MNKINFQNLPNETTPIDETNLNLLQDNIDNAKIEKTIIVRTAGEDLDEYIETGIYYFAIAYTPLNIPSGSNGWLVVIRGGGDNAIKQIWYRHGTSNTNDYETYIRTKSMTWSNWQRVMVENDLYYKAGDSATINWKSGGFLTTAATEIQFSISLPKRIPSGVTPTITSGNINVRLPSGGYLLNNVDITLDNTIKLKSYGNILDVTLTHSTAYQSTNNIPLGIQISDLVINFN